MALEEIIDAWGSCVYKLVSRILTSLGGSDDVEECCSDAFKAAWDKRRQFDPRRGSLRTWVLILARYQALDYRRRLIKHVGRKERTIVFEEEPHRNLYADDKNPETLLLDEENRREVAAALAALPAVEKEVLYRRYYLEESIVTIASALGISRGAADSRLWRARQALKEHLVNLSTQKTNGKAVPMNG